MRIKPLLQIIFLLFAVSGPLLGQTVAECIDDATISVQGNVDEIFICQGDDLADAYRFRTSTQAMPFGFVVTDENNNILLVSLSSVINLEGLPAGTLRVWGFYFLGELLAEPGLNAATDPLGSICSALTTNFITVSSVVPDGGTVATEEGLSSVTVCVGDGNPDVITFITTSASTSYSYIITDDDGIILALPAGDNADFDGAGQGVCRVYGVSHAGAIIAEVGDNIFDTQLAEECADLSDNYIEVIRLEPDGGTVSLTNGQTETTVCVGDGSPDVLSFQNTSTSPNAYVYVITDDNNVILDIADGNSADFEGAPAGICRVWGLSYTGNLIAEPGDDAAAVPLTDDCFELSGNFITVNRIEVDGATVSLTGGGTDATVCVGDGQNDILTFANTSASAENYAYIITDEDNNILALPGANIFDFTDAPPGICRVWGLSYSGNVIAEAGDNAAGIALSDECFELSENFITVNRIEVDGATVSLAGGGTEATVCANDGVADVLSFENTSGAGTEYVYVITDANNVILGIADGNSQDFDPAGPGVCRVWGLSYTGDITAGPGDDAAAVSLSSECFDLSDNFITVTRKEVDGATVSLTTGETATTVCVGDDENDILLFANTSASAENYAYVITDEDNNILALPGANIFDFNNAPPGICRVWGLSYSGNVIAEVGDNAAAVALSDECFELSENFITVNRIEVDGATVSLAGGGTEATVCANDGLADVLTFENTSASAASYVYVITDDSNVILGIADGDSQDFEPAGPGICRVWGLSYSGNITAAPGDDAAAVPLTDECFDLSDNFITVTRKEVEGGSVSLDNGENEIELCVNDGEADIVTVVSSGASGESFLFVITDNNNNILGTSENGLIDFEGVDPGICRVWGLSYSGNLIAEVGDNAASVALSDECFDLSDDFVTVFRIAADGGTVSYTDGSDFISICVGDGLPDILELTNTSMANAVYAYVITDENNAILSTSFSSSIDFDSVEPGICRIWGLSYSGDLQAGTGDIATEVELSDGCFDLSDNFVTVERTLVDGGTVSLENGETSAFICVSDFGSNELTFASETTADDANYGFIVTDETNEILVVLDGNSVDFNDVPTGTYRVWGLSYTGMITAETGDNAAGVALSDACFELSGNFIEVIVDEVEGGTIVGEGMQDIFYTCPGDGNPDVITFDSMGASGDYVYVITDPDGVILGIADGDSQDFDGAAPGTCLVWGLAYSGEILAMPGDTATNTTLTTGCFDLTDNFLTVVRETPEGGTVSLENGEAALFSCPVAGATDLVSFDSTDTSSGPYAYVVTDTANVILGLADGDSFDFSTLPNGTFRVWGLAFTGNVLAMAGDTATAVAITDDCWDLSDNFVTIIRTEPDGGTIATAGGNTEVITCNGDGEPDFISFVAQTTTPSAPYAFVITTLDTVIVDILAGDTYDFEGAADSLLVWGLAFTGNVLAEPGDVATQVAITDECWDLSDNAILIYGGVPEGGAIATADGDTQIDLCVGDGTADETSFVVTGAGEGAYIFLITDQDDFLIGTIDADSFDFDNISFGGTLRVYGLSYTGNLLVFPGDNIFEAELATGCFDLTDNFLEVNATRVDGGLLFTPSGETQFFTCPGDGESDLIVFNNTSSAVDAEYVYFLTDENNSILQLLTTPEFDFESSGVGVTHIWGASYTGDLLVDFGDILTEIAISDGCYTVSDNFIEVRRDNPAGGEVATEGEETEVIFCPTPDNGTLSFITTSTSLAGYVFVVTDEFNDVSVVADGSDIDFGALPVGLYRVWGLSYTGELLLMPGDNLFGPNVASSCFEISANFVEVYRGSEIDGGTIATLSGEEVFYTCPDGMADLIVLSTTSADTNYVYIVTDMANVVQIAPLASNLVDFDGAQERTYRIWGLSYSGDLAMPFTGLDAGTAVLSDSCYALSNNFITVNVATPTGGMVMTAEGATDTTVVFGDGTADPVTFVNQGASNSLYAYVVTDESNVIVDLADATGTYDFEALDAGTYRVWGLAYTGNIIAQIGDNAAAVPLTDDCFDLSENFVTVTEETPFTEEEGELTSEPTLELRVAPNPVASLLNVNVTLRGQLTDATSTLQLFNARGAEVLRQRIPAVSGVNHVELDVSNLPAGLYVLYVRNGQTMGQVKVMKK